MNHHLGKSELAHKSFIKNINAWHEEYLNNGLDAIISNTSGCGTTLKDYGFIFRSDENLKSDPGSKFLEYAWSFNHFARSLQKMSVFNEILYF